MINPGKCEQNRSWKRTFIYLIFSIFLQAEAMIEKQGMDKEYAPIVGVADFNKAAAKLAFGPDSQVIRDGLVRITSFSSYVLLDV